MHKCFMCDLPGWKDLCCICKMDEANVEMLEIAKWEVMNHMLLEQKSVIGMVKVLFVAW